MLLTTPYTRTCHKMCLCACSLHVVNTWLTFIYLTAELTGDQSNMVMSYMGATWVHCGFCGPETQMGSWKKLVLFTQCLLPGLSLNHRADVWSGTYFMRVCVCLELIASHGNTEWLNRQIIQCLTHSDQLAPGYTGSQYKAAVSFLFMQEGKGQQWLECHPWENWK